MQLSRPERPEIQASHTDLYYSCTDLPTQVGRLSCTKSTLAIHCEEKVRDDHSQRHPAKDCDRLITVRVVHPEASQRAQGMRPPIRVQGGSDENDLESRMFKTRTAVRGCLQPGAEDREKTHRENVICWRDKASSYIYRTNCSRAI
jgi:hypothetical protein